MNMTNTINPRTTETTPTTETTEAAGCCGGPAPQDSSACCALDAEVKSTGGTGCGCGPKATAATPTKNCCG